MPVPVRELRRMADLEIRYHGDHILAEALEGSQWCQGARCHACGFLERVPIVGGNADGQWRCVNSWHDCWSQRGWGWYRAAKKLYPTVLDRVPEPEWQYPRFEVNPGSFACWLFRPGEALSVHYWRDGRWAEYLALQALAGKYPPTGLPGNIVVTYDQGTWFDIGSTLRPGRLAALLRS